MLKKRFLVLASLLATFFGGAGLNNAFAADDNKGFPKNKAFLNRKSSDVKAGEGAGLKAFTADGEGFSFYANKDASDSKSFGRGFDSSKNDISTVKVAEVKSLGGAVSFGGEEIGKKNFKEDGSNPTKSAVGVEQSSAYANGTLKKSWDPKVTQKSLHPKIADEIRILDAQIRAAKNEQNPDLAKELALAKVALLRQQAKLNENSSNPTKNLEEELKIQIDMAERSGNDNLGKELRSKLEGLQESEHQKKLEQMQQTRRMEREKMRSLEMNEGMIQVDSDPNT